jgi:hypothetical protein
LTRRLLEMPNKRGEPYEYEMARVIVGSSRLRCVGKDGCGFEGKDVEFHKRPTVTKCPKCGKTDTFLFVNPDQERIARLFNIKEAA